MFSDDFKTIWIEFNEPVYAGEDGYVRSIKTDPDPLVGTGRTLAVTHWQDRGLWYFILLDGTCVAVPNSNIRYVYGKILRLSPEIVDEIEETPELPEPKRRGRPPKAKE